jgi:hypothetical protein
MELIPLEMTIPQIANAFAASGMFQDARGEAAAITKIIAGRSIGLDPFSSMSGLHVMQGRVEVGSHLIAGAIKRSARYDYRVREKSSNACRIEFFELGESIGVEVWTMDHARRAGLASATWQKHPKAMLFARCISSGYRTYCPDVFSCPVYSQGEIGGPIDQPGPADTAHRPAVTIDRPAITVEDPAKFPVSIDESYALTVEDLRRIDALAGTRGVLRSEVGVALRDSAKTQGIVAGMDREAKRELARDGHLLSIALELKACRDARKSREEDTLESALVVYRDLEISDVERRIACGELGIAKRRVAENHTAAELSAICDSVIAARKDSILKLEELEIADRAALIESCEIERRPIDQIPGDDLLIIVDEARRAGLLEASK